ncbi:hypothetical protein [Sphingomonas sp. PB4P5]|uniref:hypothetical protein n=1 Tax=Parasphingomonas puruogangriensis TaxID=3096155 RepID=UPI002FC92EC6
MPSERAPTEDNDGLEQAASILQLEVDRAVTELRSALSAMAKLQRLHPSLMGVIALMDRVEFHVIYDPGESAFELNEEAGVVAFRSHGLELVVEGAQRIVDEVGLTDPEEIAHQQQLAINLFIAHELLHICQNFPHFPTVADIKKGAPGIGLPLLDAVADIVAASICAHAENMRLGGDAEGDFLRRFANTLVISYAIGSLIFDARTKPEKRQRSLGLLVSAMMIQALSEDRLNMKNVNPAWKPTSPLLLLNIESSGAFNAFVVDEIAGVLFKNYDDASKPIALALWESVGTSPIHHTLVLVSTLLKQIDVIH